MPVLSTIQLTLRNDETEATFLQAFVKAAEAAQSVPGLLELKAFKLVGGERTYMAYTLWESEELIEQWVQGPEEQRLIQMGKKDLLESFLVRRFQQIADDRRWSRS